MANVTVHNGELRVRLEGLHKVWALKSTITVPMAHVVGASARTMTEADTPKGVRAPGTHIPGIYAAGTWRHHGESVFWDVGEPTQALVVELRDDSYTRLILQVDDPNASADLINVSRAD